MTGPVPVSADPATDSYRPAVLRDDRFEDRELLSRLRSDPRVDVVDHRVSMLAQLRAIRPAPTTEEVDETGRWSHYPGDADRRGLSARFSVELAGLQCRFEAILGLLPDEAPVLILRLSHRAGTAIRSGRLQLAQVLTGDQALMRGGTVMAADQEPGRVGHRGRIAPDGGHRN